MTRYLTRSIRRQRNPNTRVRERDALDELERRIEGIVTRRLESELRRLVYDQVADILGPSRQATLGRSPTIFPEITPFSPSLSQVSTLALQTLQRGIGQL